MNININRMNINEMLIFLMRDAFVFIVWTVVEFEKLNYEIKFIRDKILLCIKKNPFFGYKFCLQFLSKAIAQNNRKQNNSIIGFSYFMKFYHSMNSEDFKSERNVILSAK